MLPRIKLPKLQPKEVFQVFSEVYDWGLRDINVPDAHKQTLGEGIKIGIIDTGESTHFETTENTVQSYNLTVSSSVLDQVGHSTACAGIIAAAKDGRGIVGVAPKAQLVFLKAIDDDGVGNPKHLARAVLRCISENCDIISISAGLFFDFKPLRDAVKEAYEKNIIMVAACGNTGRAKPDIAFPARYPEVIGVGAYDRRRRAASFSSRGVSITCSCAGVDIYTTYLNNSYARFSGSSFAAPILTGVCALILSRHRQVVHPQTPCETPRQMIQHLQKYSVPLDNGDALGFGTVDAKRLVRNGT